MKTYLSILSPAVMISIVLAGCSASSHVEVAQGVNFNQFKTFGWSNDKAMQKDSRSDNDIVDNNIKNSISLELEKRGWHESNEQPDVLLDYNVTVEKGVKRETEPVYSYPYGGYFYSPFRHRIMRFYNPGFFSGYHSYNVPFKEGTLTVNMMDAKDNKLIWQGWATGDVTNKNVTTKEAQNDVRSIFKKFDLPKTSS